MKKIMYIFGFFLIFPTFSFGYSGDTSLFLSAEKETLLPNETSVIHIFLDTTNLLVENNEAIQTLSTSLSFPPDLIEIVGTIDYSESIFSTPYVNDIDIVNGSIDIVRARDTSENLGLVEIVASFVVRAKADSVGLVDIFPIPGTSSVLLSDVMNSDVFGNAEGVVFTVPDSGGSNQNPPPDNDPPPDSENGNTPPEDQIPNATLWFTTEKNTLGVGESSIVEIHMNTGSSGNKVSSTDLGISFPKDLIQIEENSVNTGDGVFGSATINDVNNATGVIELVLYENSSISTQDGLIGSFTVRRVSLGDATIQLQGFSALYSDDVNNTNTLDISASSSLILLDSNGIVVSADASPGSITEDEESIVRFLSNQAGAFTIKKETCSSSLVVVSGNVFTSNLQQEEVLSGSNLGIGQNQKFVVCVINAQGDVGESNAFFLTVTSVSSSTNTSGGGGGGGGSSFPKKEADEEKLHSSADDDSDSLGVLQPYCETVDNFSGNAREGKKIHFSWNRLSDRNIEKLEIKWGKHSGETEGSLGIPKVTSINFPAHNMEEDEKYYFRISSEGSTCQSSLSKEISLQLLGEKQEKTIYPLGANILEEDSKKNAITESFLDTPNIKDIQYVNGRASARKGEVAGRSYSQVPGTPKNGPAEIFFLIITSFGIGLFLLGRRKLRK